MEMGLRFVQAYQTHTPALSGSKKAQSFFLEIFDLVHLLLFPTVYDTEEWLPFQSDLQTKKLDEWITLKRSEKPNNTELSNVVESIRKSKDYGVGDKGSMDSVSDDKRVSVLPQIGSKGPSTRMMLEKVLGNATSVVLMIQNEM